jgi:hypothetical protein
MSNAGIAGACLTGFVCSALLLSCGERETTRSSSSVPGQFAASGKRYLLSRDKRGVITDDRMRYAIDAGARTFNFDTRQLCRQFYVGRCETFQNLSPDERKELVDVADAALLFLDGQRARSALPSQIRSADRSVLQSFLSSVR